jgi:hypothetical protein
VLLCLALWTTYAAASTGTLPHDPDSRFDVAAAWLRGRWDVPGPHPHAVGHDGRHYIVFFPGQSIAFLPLAALQVAAEDLAGVPPRHAEFGARFIAAVFGVTLFAALAVVAHVLTLIRLGVPQRYAYLSGCALGLCTPVLVYAGDGSEEVMLGATGAWALWAVIDGTRAGPRDVRVLVNRFGLACVLLALGITFRATFVAVTLGVTVVAAGSLARLRRGDPLRGAPWLSLLPWLVASAAIVAIVPAYNWLRFGDPLDTGYARYYAPHGGVYATPLLTGLLGHLVSPGKGAFLYAPWLVLAPLSLLAAGARRRLGIAVLAGLAVTVALHLFLYAKHTFWGGDWCWGVRFNVSLLPLVLLPVGAALPELMRRRALRAAIVLLALASAVVQVAGKSLNQGLEIAQRPDYYSGLTLQVPDEAGWTWHGSPWRRRWVNLATKLAGGELLPPGSPRRGSLLEEWYLFPFRAAESGSRPVRVVAWALWVLLVLTAACLWVRTARAWREPPSRPAAVR